MEPRTKTTIRVPEDLLRGMRASLREGESLNAMVVSAMDREIARRRAIEAAGGTQAPYEQAAVPDVQ